MKHYPILSLLLFSLILVSGCVSTTSSISLTSVSFSSKDEEDVITSVDGTIKISNNSITSSSSFLTSENTITINVPGIYSIEGQSNDMKIIIDVDGKEDVTLVLNNVSLTSQSGPVIKVESADKLILNLQQGTTNLLTSKADSSLGNATLDSEDDVTINGTGELSIHSHYNGIEVDDDLVITNGTISIDASNNGIKVNNTLTMKDTILQIQAGNDAIKVENLVDPTRGVVTIESGNYILSAYGDGIDSSSFVIIHNGSIEIDSGVGNNSIASVSAKGIKAENTIQMTDGTLNINAKDDALHSSTIVLFNGGSATLSSNDDGIHADSSVTFNGGNVIITKSYEGVEAPTIQVISGSLQVTSSDDGFNANSNNGLVVISGGTVYLNALGDGLDSNGTITMSGGLFIVAGPLANDNGAIDYNKTFTMTGGTILAFGSAGMPETISTSSSQYGLLVNLTSSTTNLISLRDSSGKVVFAYQPIRSIQSIAYSSASLIKNGTFKIYVGGTLDSYESVQNGYYSGGVISGGTQAYSFTITTIVTTLGQSGHQPPPGR